MKKIFLLISILFIAGATNAYAQLGFSFGSDFEFMTRTAGGKAHQDFGIGPYVGVLYGFPLSMSTTVTVGLNYKFNIFYGGDWQDETKSKLEAVTMFYGGANVMEHHIQLPAVLNWQPFGKGFIVFAGPVFDYCLSSKAKSDHRDWPFDPNMVVDSIKDLGVKPFNTYLRGGLGFGSKKFSVDFYANYGLLDLSGDGNPLRKWGVGFGMHIIL